MGKSRGGKTAAELMAKLNADPEYIARRTKKDAETEALAATCRKDETELVSELNHLGLAVGSVWDLVNNAPHEFLERKFVGAYAEAYPLLVRHLKVSHHPRIREGIIRALTVKSAKSIAVVPLLQELRSETVKSHRWVIANALKTMLPKSKLQEHPEIEQTYGEGYL